MKLTPQELVEGLKSGKRYVTEDGAEFKLHGDQYAHLDGFFYLLNDKPIGNLLKRIEVTVIEKEPDVIVHTDDGPSVGLPGYLHIAADIWCKPDKVADVEKALKELADSSDTLPLEVGV